MRKQSLLLAILCVAIGAAVVPASAQITIVRAKVPFHFTVTGKTFPAGEYKMISDSHLVRIQDESGRTIATAVTSNIGGYGRENAEVVFHCYGRRCFLSEIWSSAQDSGLELYTSRAEADEAKEIAEGPRLF